MSYKKILIATNNKGKFSEISQMLANIDIEAVPTFDLIEKLNLTEPEESAETFLENALIKAKYYGTKANLVALADDSGLCVNELQNQPGVQSARFALDEKGEKNFSLAFEKIFSQLAKQGISFDKKPRAHFICNLCLFNPYNNFHINFEGRVDGYLTYPARGTKGFGYDPIFIKDGMKETFGEIDTTQKELISHRAQAFKMLKKWLLKNHQENI